MDLCSCVHSCPFVVAIHEIKLGGEGFEPPTLSV